ncbi:type III-B CRISPR module RAMP protein Cmr6 [Rhodoferax sp.]|uniref:type III-B CRISPR module RAMP protein Cmr6 n=1 Tax=Rhodoferax sp. TaxID=50421 RepID=UPI00261315FF|nr:type III-B CRISPR module RAMP protein Cmr6 [Rhodoferax sp.]MDD2919540.1 type III-B CRISPR module RAMP protein Cmr6 [Rhodoferax sp.]
MKRPVYDALAALTERRGHAGLWYEKYCNQWVGDEPLKWSLAAKKIPGAPAQDKEGPKLKWIKTVIGTDYAKQAPLPLLAEHLSRQWALCASRNGLSLYFETTSRLVVGMGQDHPVENGFLWHPTLGLPYIPGSSIKGMLNAWLRDWVGDETFRCWFEKLHVGTSSKGVGELIFFDALPVEVPRLEADVITPHYGPYYRDPGHIPPADWHSPTPTPFLTVAEKTRFMFSIARRDGKALNTGDPEAEATRGAMRNALETIGIGAKTAVGYGRLKFNAILKAPPTSPDLVAMADPLRDFKATCKSFGSIGRNKGSQNTLVKALEALQAPPSTLYPAALDYLRNSLGTTKGDCGPGLKAHLFPGQ